MDKKQGDRLPAEKPVPGGNRRGAAREQPILIGGATRGPDDKGFGKPEGQPIDKQMPNQEMRARRDLLESERSDRDPGRPSSSEADEEMSGATGIRADPSSSSDEVKKSRKRPSRAEAPAGREDQALNL